jgi:Rrf2 family protein
MELGNDTGRAMSLRDIANRQHISLDYLEQIMPALKTAGLIKARRGAQGGYQLAKPAPEITVLEVLAALEGSLDPMACLASQPLGVETTIDGCGASGSCAVQEVWREVKTAMETVLRKLTLSELINRQQALYGGPIRTHQEEHEILRLAVIN